MPRKPKQQQIALSFVEKEDGDSRVVCLKTKSEEDAFKAMIANNVKSARRYANMTQEELAEKLYGKKSKNRICEFESGQVTPNHLQLSKISRYTGVSLDYIYGNSPEPLLDEFGVRLGMTMAMLQESVQPICIHLAKFYTKKMDIVPTSGTIALIKKLKGLNPLLINIKTNPSVEAKKKASLELVELVEACISMSERIEREMGIRSGHYDRAATDAIIHDEKVESGHMVIADMFDPVRHIVEEG